MLVEQRTCLHVDHLIRIEPVHAQPEPALGERGLQLDLVSVAPGVLGVADGLDEGGDLAVCEGADALQGRAEILLFRGELRRPRKRTPAAAAADAHEGAGCLYAVGARREDLGHAGSRERAAVGGELGLDDVSHDAALHENGLAVICMGKAVGAIGHRFDGELHMRVPLHVAFDVPMVAGET